MENATMQKSCPHHYTNQTTFQKATAFLTDAKYNTSTKGVAIKHSHFRIRLN